MHMHATPCDGTIQKVLIRLESFPYESVLRTGCLGGRGRLGAAAPVARAASRAVAHHVLGGRRWQRRPRVGWRAAGVQAVVGLVRLDTVEALPPVSAVLTRPPCRRGVREGHRRRGEPPACSTRATCASHALADGSTRVLGCRTCRDSPPWAARGSHHPPSWGPALGRGLWPVRCRRPRHRCGAGGRLRTAKVNAPTSDTPV